MSIIGYLKNRLVSPLTARVNILYSILLYMVWGLVGVLLSWSVTPWDELGWVMSHHVVQSWPG